MKINESKNAPSVFTTLLHLKWVDVTYPLGRNSVQHNEVKERYFHG